MHSTLPASQAEYEAQMQSLEEKAESARQTFIQAKGDYDRLCNAMRDLRIAWRDRPKTAAHEPQSANNAGLVAKTSAQAPQPANSAGLVMKTSAFPDRIKPHRGRHTHAATYDLGLSMRAACSKRFEEDNVDHYEESEPITCPGCQRAVQNDA
ncbi:hypothetical protein [Streptomyces roseolus]|uniref:hypothetical protein n=1 Tax=Streptomyces roseolus TaxID=67358 RepID=UPI0037BDF2A5